MKTQLELNCHTLKIMSKREFSIFLLSFFPFLQAKEINPFCSLPCKNIKNELCSKGACIGDEKYELTYDLTLWMLEEHNVYRNLLAGGTALSSFTQQSSNMNVLSWSSELQFLAQCWAMKCTIKTQKCISSPSFNSTSQNVYRTSKKELAGTKNILTTAFEYWSSDAHLLKESPGTGTVMFEGKGGFAQIAYAGTKFIGCGSATNLKYVYVVCNYYPKNPTPSDHIFKLGQPCSECKKCNRFYVNLCGQIETPPFFNIELNLAFKIHFNYLLLPLINLVSKIC